MAILAACGWLVVAGLVVWVVQGWWHQHHSPLPEPGQVPHHALAWLRGGWRGGLQLAIFQLWREECLQVTTDLSGEVVLESLPKRPNGGASPLPRLLHKNLNHPTPLRRLLTDRTLQRSGDAVIRYHEEPLVRHSLWRGAEGRMALLVKFALLIVAIVAFKLSGSTDMVDFLLLVLVGAVVIWRPWRRGVANVRGKRFLRRSRGQWEWTLPHLRQREEPAGEVDPLLLVALYGLSGAAPWLPVPPPPLADAGVNDDRMFSDSGESWGSDDGGTADCGDGGDCGGGDGGGD